MPARCPKGHSRNASISTLFFCWSVTALVAGVSLTPSDPSISSNQDRPSAPFFGTLDLNRPDRKLSYPPVTPSVAHSDNGQRVTAPSSSSTSVQRDSISDQTASQLNRGRPSVLRSATVYPVLIRNHTEHVASSRTSQLPEVSATRSYRFTAFNQTFLLRLHPDARFLAPNYDSDINWTRGHDEPGGHHRSCFYVGVVVGDPESRVALGLCHGLLGLIHTSDADFTIEPETFSSSGASQHEGEGKGPGLAGEIAVPHILEQIRAKDGGRLKDAPSKVICDVQDSSPPSASKRKRKKTKRHRAHSDEDGSTEEEGSNYQQNGTSGSRRKRSVSSELHMELMLVTDKKMHDLYGRNLEKYVLTLMSTVATVFRDPSIGNDISIALVKHRRLSEDESREIIGSTSAKTLDNFCKWQYRINKFEDHDPDHFDVAILLTREDLCRSVQLCDVLGLAQKGLVCDTTHNCAIVEDSGLHTAFTIIHELGHILSMPHDHELGHKGDCDPFLVPGSNLHVMSRMLDSNSDAWSWSACSRHHFTNLLDSGSGYCLMDKPVENLLRNWPIKHPGEMYDLDHQCFLQFGPMFRACHTHNVTCERLWCSAETVHTSGATCKTQHTPWADGSNCTTNHLVPMWCQKAKCVAVRVPPEPIHGSWSEWRSVGECSRSCGGGIKRSIRECDNPRPVNGGKYCLGLRTRYHSCNIHECPPNSPDFRAMQCARFNGNPKFPIVVPGVGWTPDTKSHPPGDICKLYCRSGGEIRRMQEKVIDGTPCGMEPGTYSICVNGRCIEPGCDRILGSNKAFDICGKCGGDNSTCKVISGSFNEAKYGYNNVVIIPSGATYIDIQQHGHQNMKDDNYLVLVDRNGVNILNGNFNVTASKKNFYYGDVLVEYTGSSEDVERVNITKPIQKELIVQVLIVGSVENPNVRYHYTISSQDENEFDWEYEPKWQPCNRVCGGEQFRDPLCYRRKDHLIVSEGHCRKDKKLPRKAQACNLECELRWHAIQVSQCSSLCGPGTRKRVFNCRQVLRWAPQHEQTLVDSICLGQLGPKPPELEECEGTCPRSHWEYGEWSQCSKSCGGGEQFRSAHCVNDQGHKHEEHHCDQSQMVTSRGCNVGECPRWETDSWTDCSVTCGTGERQRPYWCQHGDLKVTHHFCPQDQVPEHKEACVVPCYAWHHGLWSACSVTCGEGIQRRTVQCLSEDGGGRVGNNSLCDLSEKPYSEIICRRTPCVTPSPSAYYSSFPPNDQIHVRHEVESAQFSRSRDVWRMGPFGECSRTCGGGTMRRQVVCSDERNPIETCGPKPPEEMPCNEQACPVWAVGPWEKCNKECGKGSQKRMVKCTDHVGQAVGDFQCDPYEKPATSQKCEGHNCYTIFATTTAPPRPYRWHAGSWSQCCDGMARRQVICIDQNEISVPIGRCEGPAPKKRRPCGGSSSDPRTCPRWVRMDKWSQCFGSCGNSTQTQSWTCRLGQATVDEEWCDQPKPKLVTRPCLLKHCSYRWSKNKWTKCSANCGKGNRRRQVECQQANGSRVDDKYCSGIQKPKMEKKCRSQTCPYNWVTSHWSECSRPCGLGTQRRTVSCHRANAYGWIDPTPVPQPRLNHAFSNWCNVTDKLADTRSCNLGSCNSRSLWKAGPYQPCTVECGRGRQQRRVKCLDRNGKKLSKDQCDIRLKPKNRRRCVMKTCNPMTCLDIKKSRNANRDGEYTLNVRGKNIRVYCKDMHKSHPREYVTLNSESDNYSVVYQKLNYGTCSSSRYYHRPSDSCGCPEQFLIETGRTVFKRIAINITSLRVYPYDYLYSVTSGSEVPYGQSICTDQYRCPQSKFRLNLQGTGLRISPETRWVGQGGRPATKIQKTQNGQGVQGKCGGNCGSCIPSPELGLRLDVTPP